MDDSSTVRKVVRELLEQLGFKNIDEASDGEAALARVGEKEYALVIADWHMAPMNGQMLLERIRGDETHKNLRFIMMTAEPAIEKIIQANHVRVVVSSTSHSLQKLSESRLHRSAERITD